MYPSNSIKSKKLPQTVTNFSTPSKEKARFGFK